MKKKETKLVLLYCFKCNKRFYATFDEALKGKIYCDKCKNIKKGE